MHTCTFVSLLISYFSPSASVVGYPTTREGETGTFWKKYTSSGIGNY